MSTNNEQPLLKSKPLRFWLFAIAAGAGMGLAVILSFRMELPFIGIRYDQNEQSIRLLTVAAQKLFMDADTPLIMSTLAVNLAAAHVYTAVCLAFGVGLATFGLVKRRTPRRLNAKYIAGAKYAEGRDVKVRAAELLAEDQRLSGSGIALSPDIFLPHNREIQSMLIIGRPRYGKTTAVRYMLDGILSRPNDKMIVYDCKGDVASEWPNDKVIFLAPHDTRSWAWAVGEDVLGETGARELASSLIAVSDREPNWTLGGQEILVAMIRGLQAERKTSWSWQDLSDVADLRDKDLRSWAWRYHRPALRYLTLDPDTREFDRTAASYVSTAMAPFNKLVRPLAQAWGKIDPKYQFSLRSWLNDEAPERRTIIFQRAAHLPAISEAWITAALDLMARFCVGPALPDSTTRRIWYVLDEFSTVPKINGITDLLAQGPAKGVCVILACQNLELVEKCYGRTTTASFVQNVDVQLLFRMNAGPTSKYLTEVGIPKTELRRHGHKEEPDKKGSTKHPQDRETLCLVTTHDLATLPRGEGFAIIEGSVLRIRWPKSTWSPHRRGTIEAQWVTEQRPLGP